MTEEQVWTEIGRRIRLIRQWRGMNQETLAARMRLTRVSVTNAETGRQKFPVWNLIKLSEIFDVPPHIWLLMPDDWAAWCRVNQVTIKQVRVIDRTFTREYKRRRRIVEVVEVS